LETKFVGMTTAVPTGSVVSEDGRISGYAAIYDVMDRGDDVIVQGAFKSLPAALPMLWAHDPKVVIGVWDKLELDTKGLKASGYFLEGIQKAEETKKLLLANAVGGLSIGYSVAERNFKTLANGTKVRYITDLDVFEISVTPTPMAPLARINGTKSTEGQDLLTWLRDFNRQLGA
jgi:hypothetical protein